MTVTYMWKTVTHSPDHDIVFTVRARSTTMEPFKSYIYESFEHY